ncbi:hypothetical protein [Massilia sp. TN1-12]|uniref:hypothetical protein n=1 Tax=Massilia paldalensis TaxID=3377675 RepID=UPI00385018D2
MFKPNLRCRIQLSSGENDVYGQPIPGRFVNERCAVVKLEISNEKTSVRADSSASRGNAIEEEVVSIILLTNKTKAEKDDIIEVSGVKLRIAARHPRFDVTGRLDHYEIRATMWAEA